jgi:PAS domain-containing protein
MAEGHRAYPGRVGGAERVAKQAALKGFREPLELDGGLLKPPKDITARKTAEARATEADERYRTLVEQIPAITYIELPSPDSADETRFVYLSSHLGRMLHPDDRDRVISLNGWCERTGEPFDSEHRVIAKDGTVVWLHSKATLVRDAAGTPRFWHGVSMDVSVLHRAEEHVREVESRYEKLASRMTRPESPGD